MAARLLLGIDAGTTLLKVCAFSADTGRIVSRSSQRLAVRTLADGGREQAVTSVDRAFGNAIEELRAELGSRWSKVTGVGLAAQGGSSIIADRVTGRALTNMVLWSDGRSHAHLAEVANGHRLSFWRRVVLRDVVPAGLGRLLWLKEQQPDLFVDSNIHVGLGEYLFFKLTGTWRQDPGNAIQIGSYDAARRKLVSTLFSEIGVPLDFVAPLRQGHETAPISTVGARRFGLPESIPVVGPYIDQEAGYLSAVGVVGKPLQCSLGTAWVANFVLPRESTGRSASQLVLPSPVCDGRLVVQPLLCGNATWDWSLGHFVDHACPDVYAKAARVFRKSLLPKPGLLCIPMLTQQNPLQPEAFGACTYFGAGPHTDHDEFLRATACGMAFELARVFAGVKDSRAVDGVVLGGGASKGTFFQQLIAGLFAPLPVWVQDDQDLSAARGSVFALSQKGACSTAKAVKAPAQPVIDEIRSQFASYGELFNRLYSHVSATEPFKFAPKRRT